MAEPLTTARLDEATKEAQTLPSPSEIGEDFARHLANALQTDAHLVIAHVNVVRLLNHPKE